MRPVASLGAQRWGIRPVCKSVYGSSCLGLGVVALPICVFTARVSRDAFRLPCLRESR